MYLERGGVEVVSNQLGYVLPGTNVSVRVGLGVDPGNQEFDAGKAIRIACD